ncbi:MAG: homocysteine S-methyltransferase [Gemmataceae bacterium]|nr:homocysteine S-methyltransferase [Gemmataceae bacterium]
MNPLQPFLDRRGVVLLDGAMATELERRGADLRDPLWSAKVLLENPDLIRQVHLDYFRAGADVATTASYQVSYEGFAQRGLDWRKTNELLALSVGLAEQARAQFLVENPDALTPLVAASIGCYGATLHDGSEYRGDYSLSLQQLVSWHAPRFDILTKCRVNLVACETIPCLLEAEALAVLFQQEPETPVWVSFSCKDEQHVCHGESLAECVALFETIPNVIAVGVNCTAPRFVEGLLRSIQGKTKKLLLAYPNSGEGWDAERQTWTGTADCDWTSAASSWHAAGARLIGGCCRTTPQTIRGLAQAFPLPK